jgi:protein-disulfide isomerase-like protein with CxxC motif
VADLEFFFDPVCPWAWITSRWVDEVRLQRGYEVSWKFISLKLLNEGNEGTPPFFVEAQRFGHGSLRVASAARATEGNVAVDRFYTAMGTALHVNGRSQEAIADRAGFVVGVLRDAGLSDRLADAFDDTAHDEVIRFETQTALDRVGTGVGTPILTFKPRTDRAASVFGPVVSRTPRGEEAVRLWDAVEVIASSGVSEIKRTLRSEPRFD